MNIFSTCLLTIPQVFDLCDKDGNGFITKPELSDICQQYSEVEESGSLLDNVMGCLDAKHDGHISFEEFKAGFEVRSPLPLRCVTWCYIITHLQDLYNCMAYQMCNMVLHLLVYQMCNTVLRYAVFPEAWIGGGLPPSLCSLKLHPLQAHPRGGGVRVRPHP